MGFLLGTLGFITLMALSSIWRGFVLTKLWLWFIVPVFHLPALGLAAAIGVSLVISFLTYQVDHKEHTEDDWTEMFGRGIIFATIYPLFALGIGWVVTLFM